MLILSRKVGEALVVNDSTTIRLLDIKGGQIKLGIEAPDEVAIHREEVFLKIVAENKKAASSSTPDDLPILAQFVRK